MTLGSARIGLAVLTAAILVGCLPEAATAEARRVTDLYVLFMVAAAVVFVIVAGLIGWSILRYRRGDRNELPPQTRANMAIEITWWVLPTLLVSVLIVSTIGTLARVDEAPGDEALIVEVDAFQWGWRFEFPDAGVTVAGTAIDPPRIQLPLGRPVTFVLLSEDVVHSFYVPRFLMKRDNVPGQENRMTVTIDEQGTYAGQCGEFCGLLHQGMRFEIDAVPADAFEAWLAEQGAEG